MKRGMIFVAGLATGVILFFFFQPVFFAPVITAIFSPEEGHDIIGFIDSAEKTIDIEMYVFSSRDAVEALERAKAKGVEIRIIIERNVVGGENDAMFRELSSKGFNVRFASKKYQLTHSKFIIIDGKALLVGSHNLSNSALYKNREASVIIRDASIVGEFEDVFRTDWAIAS